MKDSYKEDSNRGCSLCPYKVVKAISLVFHAQKIRLEFRGNSIVMEIVKTETD